MLRPSRFVRALIALLCLSSVSLAQSPAAGSAAPAPSSSTVELPGELSSFFPAETTGLFIEAHNVGASFERQPGALEQIYASLPMILQAKKDGAAGTFPLTLEELRLLLRSDVAYGASAGLRTSNEMLAVIRTASPEAAGIFRDKLLPLVLASSSKERRTETVNGQVVTTVGAGSSGFAYAITGATVVIGSVTSVRALYDTTSKSAAKLTDAAGFASARRRLSSSAETFMWVDIEHSMPSEGKGGTMGINGVAIATTDGLAEMLLALDRSRESLASVLADAPPVDLHAAELLPPNVQAVATFGFQPARVFDYLVSPVAAEDFGRNLAPSPQELAQAIETATGVRAREELFAALGDRMTVAFDFADIFGDAKGVGAIGGGVPRPLFLVEVTQPDVARRALVRLYSSAGAAPTEETVDGVVVSRAGDTACAVVDNIAILGDRKAVDRSLAAHKSGETFAASPASAPLREQLAGNTIAAIYLSSELEKMAIAKIVQEATHGAAGQTDLGLTPAPFVGTANKEELGLYASTRAAASMGASVIGIAAAIAIPSLMRARAAANESSAIGTLRSIASAEATYQSRKRRYGTFTQLVAAGYLDASLCDGCVRNGYRFRQTAVTARTFDFAAEPEPGPTSGDKSYNVIDDYIIRYATSPTAPKGKTGKILGGGDVD